MVVVVDYGMGNLRSVAKAITACGEQKMRVSGTPSVVNKAKKIILPGVVHLGKTAKELKRKKLFFLIKQRINEGVPFFGICVGMQLLFKESEEAPGVQGLGVIKGKVKRFNAKKLIVPHMGWNQVKIQKGEGMTKADRLFKGVRNESFFYFAHSYYCRPSSRRWILASTAYGVEFASCVHKDNVWGIQFHPEKSQQLGLKVLKNFLCLC